MIQYSDEELDLQNKFSLICCEDVEDTEKIFEDEDYATVNKLNLQSEEIKYMFIICYADNNGKATWEPINGEDAMHIRVSELCDEGLDSEDIMVFDMKDEIK